MPNRLNLSPSLTQLEPQQHHKPMKTANDVDRIEQLLLEIGTRIDELEQRQAALVSHVMALIAAIHSLQD